MSDRVTGPFQALRRRSLWRALVFYVVASWAVLQVVDTLGGALDLPGWLPSVALVLLLVGLPVVVATAVVQEGAAAWRLTEAAGARVGSERSTSFTRFLTWRYALGGGILAFALWGAVAAAWVLSGRTTVTAAAGPQRPSIAVLPLDHLSPDPDDRYIADGMHDEIIAQIAKVGSIEVISRTSVLEYRDSPKNIRTIAAELGVSALLEGSLRRTDDRVRITTQLIDAASDNHLWVETYDHELTAANLFDVQEEVARNVTAALAASLSPEEDARLSDRPTDDTEAYNLYLQGNDYLTRSDQQVDYEIAQSMYERAVEIDPDFALAHARLSKVHSAMFWYFFDRSDERARLAGEAVDRALALDPDVPEVREAVGLYHYWVRLDYDRALAELGVARERWPNHADLMMNVGYVQRRQGRWDEAAESLARGSRLNPRSSLDALQVGVTHLYTGDYARAIRDFERATELAPDLVRPYVWAARTHLNWTGDTERARSLIETAERSDPRIVDNQDSWHWAVYRVLDDGSDWTATRAQEMELSSAAYHLANADLAARRGASNDLRAHYDSARVVLEASLGDRREEARFHSELGIALAGLGDAAGARVAGLRAVELTPVGREAMLGQDWLLNLARIHILNGDLDEAVEQIEGVLSAPSPISAHWLRIDPIYAPLAGHPGFEALLLRPSG